MKYGPIFLSICFLGFFMRGVAQSYLESPLPKQWNENIVDATTPPECDWWKSLGDPLLDSLIEVSLRDNQNVATAYDRIRIAQSALRIAESNYYPTITANGSWQTTQSSLNDGEPLPVADRRNHYGAASLQGRWEIDVAGGIRHRVRAQRELLGASQADFKAAQLTLCSQLATTYVQLRTLQQEYIVATKNLNSQKGILHITEVRFTAGLTSQLDVAQAKSIFYSTQAVLPTIESQVNNSIYAIAVLMGKYPSDILSSLKSPQPIPQPIHLISTEIPSSLLRYRPDILAAERTIAAQAAQVKATVSNYFPSFYINASVGYSARDANQFFKKESLLYAVTPTISWTLFQGRARVEATKESKAQLDIALHSFNQTLLTAVQEVEFALSNYTGVIKQIVALREAAQQANHTLQLSLDMYKQGLSPFQNVLDAQRSMLQYENSLVMAQGNALEALISLYNSLGGYTNLQNN